LNPDFYAARLKGGAELTVWMEPYTCVYSSESKGSI